MIIRRVIKKFVPSALPLAAAVFGVSISWQVFASSADGLPKDDKAQVVEADAGDKGAKASGKKSSKSKPESSGKRYSKVAPSDVSVGSRIKELVYSPSDVYVIRAKYGYQTNIVFDPKEDIQSISVGDRSLWQIIPSGNRLFIRPMTDNLSTNMTILTGKRSYEFDLKSVDKRGESNVYVVRFVYPSESDKVIAALAAADSLATMGGDGVASPVVPSQYSQAHEPQNVLKLPSSYVEGAGRVTGNAGVASLGSSSGRNNYSYTYAGPDALAPLQVYDDGKTTFIKYQAIAQEVPAVFKIDASGRESSIPVTVQGSSLLVSGVAGELALRGGGGEVRIYNESLGGL